MRAKKQIIKILISTLLLLSCMTLFVGCNNEKSQTTVSSSSDTLQNDNNSNSSNSDSTKSQSRFSLKQVEFSVNGAFSFVGDSDYGIFSYNNKKGIIDKDGNIAIEPIYKNISYPSVLSGNLVIAENDDGNFVIIDVTTGKEVGSINGNETIPANKIYEINNPSVLYGDDGDDYIGFSEGCVFMNITSWANDQLEEDYNSVCIDKNGKDLFYTKYKMISNYNNGVAVGYYSENYSAPKTLAGLDKNGKELWTVENVKEYERQSDGVIIYQDRDSSLYGAIDIKGNKVLECKYENLTRAGNGLIGFKKYGLWGYLDYKGNEVIKPQFTNAQKFKGGIALVEKDNEQYFINTNCETVIDNVGTGASYYGNGIVILDYVSVYDSEGNPVWVNKQSISYDRVSNALNYNGGKIIKEGATGKQKFYQVIESK